MRLVPYHVSASLLSASGAAAGLGCRVPARETNAGNCTQVFPGKTQLLRFFQVWEEKLVAFVVVLGRSAEGLKALTPLFPND